MNQRVLVFSFRETKYARGKPLFLSVAYSFFLPSTINDYLKNQKEKLAKIQTSKDPYCNIEVVHVSSSAVSV